MNKEVSDLVERELRDLNKKFSRELMIFTAFLIFVVYPVITIDLWLPML